MSGHKKSEYEGLTDFDAFQFAENIFSLAILDKEGRYIYINPGWCKHSIWATDYGIDPKTLPGYILGKSVWEVVPGSKAGYTLETGKLLTGQFLDSSLNCTSYIPRYDSEGNPNGCYIMTILNSKQELDELSLRVENAPQGSDFYMKAPPTGKSTKYTLDNIKGTSPLITHIKDQILVASRAPSPVLIEGASGTGKEFMAHTIHGISSRSDTSFIKVNCSAIPAEMAEAEFLGYKSGAGPAGKKSKTGLLEMANHGTLFMDDIESLPMTVQPKLLEIIQDGEFRPLGGDKKIPFDVKIISSSSVSLKDKVKEGKFREDLYFKLSVLNIVVPPLRSRKEDIAEIAKAEVQRLSTLYDREIKGIDKRALRMLEDYDWPGNIRELQNALERAIATTRSQYLIPSDFDGSEVRTKMEHSIGYSSFSGMGELGGLGEDLRKAKSVTEKNMIYDALTRTEGNKSAAAKLLGISRNEFYRKLKKYSIE